jgi:aminoglycoside phosphotransferase (APT) family kinase protein
MSTPIESVLVWAANAIALNARVVAVQTLHDGSGPWLLRIEHRAGATEALLRVAADRRRSPALAADAAALTLAEKHRLAAPRLIAADLDGTHSGQPAVLETVLPGSSQIPLDASDGRLHAYGAAGAALHRIRCTPTAELPPLTRPAQVDDHAAVRRWAARYQVAASEADKEAVVHELHEATGRRLDLIRQSLPKVVTTPLLLAADERLRGLPVPDTEPVLLHGDLWFGNTVWTSDTDVGLVDWGSAGVGHYGVDLGAMRTTAVLVYGQSAADTVLDGWQQASGHTATDVAYFDAVVALQTPADMSGRFIEGFHRMGRPDLDPQTAHQRRDMFLQAALDNL